MFMTRELLDSEGNKVEVPDDAELKTLQEKADQTDALQGKIKELEEGVNPDWRKVRQEQKALEVRLAEAEAARSALKSEAEKQGVRIEEDKKFTADDIGKLAEEKANQVFLSRYRALQVAQFGERAKEVDALVGKLAAGEQLTEESLMSHIQIAARALGLESNNQNNNMNIAGSSGFVPDPKDLGDNRKRFSETEEGQQLAGSLGLDDSTLQREANKDNNASKQ